MGLLFKPLELAVESPLETIVTVVIGLILYKVIIYPFYLNPLHKIPGPALYKITNLFNLNDQRTEQRNEKVDQWHKKYGSVIQISPNEVSLSSVKSLKDIYVKKNLDKSTFYAQFVNFGEKNAFSIMDQREHIQRKKLMTKVYTKSAVFSESSQRHLNHKVGNVVNFVEKRLTKPLDVYELFNSLAMDVVTYYELGSQFSTDLILNLKDREIIKAFRASSSMWFYTTLLPKFWNLAASKETAESSKQARIWTETKFKEAYDAIEKNEVPLEPSLIRTLYDMGLPKWAIGSEMFDHVAAGHETTGTSLAYASWQLSRPCNAYLQDKIYEELKENFGDFNDSVELSKLDKLPLLDAVVSELTRLHAAIPGAEPRQVSKNSQVSVELADGTTISLPKGTIVSVQPWTVQRDPSIFSSPDSFKPERWLQQPGETEDEFKDRYKLMKSTSFAFGQGNRMCLGMNVALIEIKLCIAKLYWHFHSHVSLQWCTSGNFEDGDILMGASKLKGKKKDELSDVELMTMADSYTSRPLFDECWLEWTRR